VEPTLDSKQAAVGLALLGFGIYLAVSFMISASHDGRSVSISLSGIIAYVAARFLCVLFKQRKKTS
jgi:hypothetical protein